MAVRATFIEFHSYKLNGVTVTDRVLGHGSYAIVLEVEYMGLKCAGKKIHELLLEQGDASYTVRRFEEECRLLSQVRHPNVVQFLGVHFQQRVPAPILVMEFLSTNLTSCIEQYGILPKEISYSILHDVALGLCYLHSQTPSIIHRDLSANNVLLATNMAAKISDLGVARILNLNPLQVIHMTKTPGTPAYMPPEVMIANPKYDTSVDEFSYGILMVHIFSGRWPEPQVGPNRIDGDRLVPVSEAERREVFLRAIGNDHPLMDLILRCINNNPRSRAHANEIVERLTAMVLQFPSSFANRLDILRQIERLEEEKRVMMEERDAENQQKDQQISILRKEAHEKEEENVQFHLAHSSEVKQLQLRVRDVNSQNQQKDQQISKLRKEAQEKQEKSVRLHRAHSSEMKILQNRVRYVKSQNQQKDQQISKLSKEAREKEEESVRLHRAHSSEVEQLQLQVKDVNSQNQLLAATNIADITDLKTKVAVYEAQIEQLMRQHENGIKKFETTIARQREEFETRITSEKKSSKRLTRENDELQAEISQSVTNTNSLEQKITTLKAETSRKDATIDRNESELEAKTTVLKEKDTIISGMREQLTRTRQHLSSKQQVVQASITWKQCANVPTGLKLGKTTVINGKVYCGGGTTYYDEDEYIVCCYDPSQDNWTTLPPLPVRYFGLGQVNGKLVAVGGRKKSDNKQTNEVFTYDERSRKWKHPLPPMLAARSSPGVLCLQSGLVVAGGYSFGYITDAVEIFKADTSQWYRTDRLPTACHDISLVVIGNTCYVLGGYNHPLHLNQALYATVDDLLSNAVPANQTTRSGSHEDTQSAWKKLVNIPTYGPAAAMLSDKLLAIGGKETSEGRAYKIEVYMFSPSTNAWIYISDLPEARSYTAVAVLSSTEILVIGGECYGKVNTSTTYKASLYLKL